MPKNCYLTHNGEFLAIYQIFKAWQNFIKNCKQKVLMLTNYNNYCCFMNKKSLNFQ